MCDGRRKIIWTCEPENPTSVKAVWWKLLEVLGQRHVGCTRKEEADLRLERPKAAYNDSLLRIRRALGMGVYRQKGRN